MKSSWTIFISIAFIALFSCKSKEPEPEKNFHSVVSMIKQQVAGVDTSLDPIIKIITVDSSHIDTISISREDFSREAKDFLEIPDLADKKVARRYKQELLKYDETMGRVIFKYTPVDPDNEEVKLQEFLATPDLEKDAKINNIFIIREINNRDSFLQKKMLWQMDRSFQVVTTSQKPGKPETTTVTKVVWHEDPYQ